MKNLLFPTDFSSNSIKAIHYGIKLMKGEKFTASLLHAYDIPVLPANDQAILPTNYVAELVESSKAGLKRVKDILVEEHPGIKLDIQLLSKMGPLKSAVKETLEEQTVDLIVMGTLGASGIKKLLIGSNTFDVMKQADCPVLSIPEDVSFVPPKNIMFSTDFKPIDHHARLEPLKWIARKYDATVNILNVVKKGQISKLDKSTESLKINQFLSEVKHQFYFVENERVEEGITNAFENNPSEILAMIIHDLPFFERIFHASTTRKIALQAKIPLLTIHA